MKKRNEDNHNSLGKPDDQLPAEVLKKLNELLERLHRLRDLNIIKLKNEKIEEENNEKYEREKSIQINIYEKGSQHIDTQINWKASPPTPLAGERGVDSSETTKGLPEMKRKNAKNNFDKNTPLSALFWKSHHEELKKVLETWRPYLKGEAEDVMGLNTFLFDLSQIRPSIIYLDLAHLINHGGLQSSVSALATYMFQHSNLSKSANALYVQLKRYKKLCE